jgi:hypothetical protein
VHDGQRPAPFGDGIPDGVPLGRVFLLPPRLLCEDLYRAVRSLAQVHGDGDLAPIPVLLRPRLPALATFVTRQGWPSEILVRTEGNYRGFVFLHEVGHLLDFAAFGAPGTYASASGVNDFATWRDACLASRAVRELHRVIDHVRSSLGADADRVRRLQRFLDIEELWARGYAQYVAVQSGDPALLTALDAFRTRPIGPLYYPLQWDDGDFSAIGAAIEAMIRRQGWRSERPS